MTKILKNQIKGLTFKEEYQRAAKDYNMDKKKTEKKQARARFTANVFQFTSRF